MFNLLSDYDEGLSNYNHEIIKVKIDIDFSRYKINICDCSTSFIVAITDCRISDRNLRANTILTTSEFCELTYGEAFIITAPETNNRPEQTIKIPSSGAYKYIDGCTDSLLVPPVFRGDDCLNALYFPPGIKQTMHTHTSFRLGYILEGAGICHWENDKSDIKVEALTKGDFFWLNAETLHCFETQSEKLTVIAYHPDSDVGMTDENHPMLNKTVIKGVPANLLRHQGLA